MNKEKIDHLVEEFFLLADTQPERHLELFQEKIRHMTMDEIWEVMNIITNRVSETIDKGWRESMAVAA